MRPNLPTKMRRSQSWWALSHPYCHCILYLKAPFITKSSVRPYPEPKLHNKIYVPYPVRFPIVSLSSPAWMLSQTNPLFVPRLCSAQTQAALSCSPGSRAFCSQIQELLRLWFQCDWHWWGLRVGQLIPTKGQHASYSEKMLCKGAMHVKDNFSGEKLFPS